MAAAESTPPLPSPAAVERLPVWLAPNLITLLGLLLLAGGYTVLLVTVPGMTATDKWWAHAAMGFATFAYLHLDCLDGKQARRTGTSSPLGQLFDHGCDALAVHLLLVGVAPTMDAGLFPRSVWGQLAVGGPWLMAHWEEYHTGVMLYGNGWWGVTEANYILVCLHACSAAFGPRFMRTPLIAIVPSALAARCPSLASFMAPYGVNDFLLSCVNACGVWQFASVLGRIFVLRTPRGLPRAEAGHKQLGVGSQLSHLLQLALLVAVGTLAMLEPIYAHRGVWHVRAAFGMHGAAYALEASRLIMAHMAKEPFAVAAWPLAVMASVTANSVAGGAVVDPFVGVVGGMTIILIGYLHYVVSVVGDVTAYLGIKCLTIPVAAAGKAALGNGGAVRRSTRSRSRPRRE